jgi:hypothetical protein
MTEPIRIMEELAAFTNDPYHFVLFSFPWGEKDTELEHFKGPEPWQQKVLLDIKSCLERGGTVQDAIQIAVASGHGVGKSCLVSWIILWAISTFEHTRGVVTANTETQLKTKTWAELGKWYRLFIGREFFKLTATALFSDNSEYERTWRIDMVPWSERNTEAFAGMHNKNRRVVLIMDEASAIPDVIWETAEGALTDSDTQIIWCVFGNPTRSTGRFRECFPGGRFESQWTSMAVDSREVSITKKSQFIKWIAAYGDDSDFVRIRVKGMFPRVGLMEFFSAADIEAAMTREVSTAYSDPLAVGVDVARFGANSSVIWPRKGRDARSIPRKVYNGINTVELATRVFEVNQDLHADGLFIDGGGVGGGVVDTIRNMHLFCHEVQFGGKDDVGGMPWGIQGEKYANKRAAMYGAARAWMKGGALPNDPELRTALLAIKYSFNVRDEIILISKEDIMEEHPGISLDDVDALVLTFAYPLAGHAYAGGEHMKKDNVESEYDPYAPERMVA